MKYLITFLLFLSCELANAGSCETVDLRDELGPVLNQDGVGICYAYSAADILSFKLGKRVSPVDIALQYIKRRDDLLSRGGKDSSYINQIEQERMDKVRNGGWVNYALRYSQDAGFCEDEKINSNDFRSDHGLFQSLVNLNQLGMQQYSLSTANSATCSKFSQIKNVFPGVSISEIQNVANRSNLITVGTNLANKACEPRFKATTPLRFKSLGNRGTLSSSQFDELDRVLSKKQPISLTVRMEKLYSFGKSSVSKQALHAITLAGRKFNPSTGKCEYILKNSWGPECDRYYKVRCERGYVFVPEDVLKSVIQEADYIE